MCKNEHEISVVTAESRKAWHTTLERSPEALRQTFGVSCRGLRMLCGVGMGASVNVGRHDGVLPPTSHFALRRD